MEQEYHDLTVRYFSLTVIMQKNSVLTVKNFFVYGHNAINLSFDRKRFFAYDHNSKNLFFYHKKYINLVNFHDLKIFLRKILCYDNDFYGHKRASLYFDRKQCK